MLSDVQRFWLSLQRAKNISTAVNSDGGDVAQLLLLRPDNRYSFVAPRFLLDTLPNGKTRDATDKSVLPKDLNNAPRGGTLMSFYIRDASQNAAAQNDDNRVLDGAEISKRNAAHSAEF